MGLNDLPSDQAEFLRRFVIGAARLERDLADRAQGIAELTGMLDTLLADGTAPRPGTTAADLALRIEMIETERQDLINRLAEAEDDDTLDDITQWLAELDSAGKALFDALAAWAAAPDAAAFNDPDAGARRAAELDLPPPDALPCPDPTLPGANYQWVIGADGTLRLSPTNDDLPDCRYDPDTGQFVFSLNRGWTTDTESDFNWFANNPLPNARYEYENGYTYETDDTGRTTRVSAVLQDDPWDRDLAVQREAGHVGVRGTPEGRTERYDGGHLIPRELGGPPGKLNLIPMQSTLNRTGEWRQMERLWRDLVDQGHEVEVDIELSYYAEGNEDRRNTPESFSVTLYVGDTCMGTTVVKNTSTGT